MADSGTETSLQPPRDETEENRIDVEPESSQAPRDETDENRVDIEPESSQAPHVEANENRVDIEPESSQAPHVEADENRADVEPKSSQAPHNEADNINRVKAEAESSQAPTDEADEINRLRALALSTYTEMFRELTEIQRKKQQGRPRKKYDPSRGRFESIQDAAAPSREVHLQYINFVKDALGPYNPKYLEFFDLITLYKEKRTGVLSTIVKLKELLKEHQILLRGFNAYLPDGFHILTVEPERPQMIEAVFFFNKIQENLQDDDGRYLVFQILLSEFLEGKKTIMKVKQDIHRLFPTNPEVTAACFLFINTCASEDPG